MNSFERALMADNSIPFNDAADFFLKVRAPEERAMDKHASLSEAPDETGELEGKFEVSPEQVAALIQNSIAKAVALMQAGAVYRSSIRGPLAYGAKQLFNTYPYADVIEALSKRASVLAGAVHLGDIETPPATTNPEAAVRAMIRGEQELIQSLNELKIVCGENPLGTQAACWARCAQERMDDCWMFLDPVAPTPTEPAHPEGLEAHEEHESPERESIESPEFQAAEQASGVEGEEELPEEELEEVPEEDPEALEYKSASARFKVALSKLANGGALGQEAPMAPPGPGGPAGQQLEPTNYLAAEMAGRQAQEQQESAYYRSQVQEAQQAAQAGQQQMQELASQMEQLQMQQQQTEATVQQSQQQALSAQDEALRQTQAAANMRMAMQQMRASLMELASQDPAAQAASTIQGAGGEVPGAQMGQEVPQEGDASGQAPAQPMTPGAAAPQGGPQQAEQPQSPQGMDPAMMAPQGVAGVKAAGVMDALKSRLPGALVGAGLGAGFHHSLKGDAPGLRDSVQTMEAEQGGFFKAMLLAKEKAHLAQAERAEQHPGASLAFNTARGAMLGGMMGPAIQDKVRSIAGR